MKVATILFFAFVAIGAWANPSAEVVSFGQDPTSAKRMKIVYSLSEKAVVTAEMFAGTQKLPGSFDGDVNRLFDAGEYTAYWRPADEVAGGYAANALKVDLSVWDPEDPPDYMAVDLYAPTRSACYYASAEDVPGSLNNRLYVTDSMLFRRVHAAGITWKAGRSTSAGRTVKLTKDYYLAVYEVTRKQWAHLVNSSSAFNTPTQALSTYPLVWERDDFPVQPSFKQLRPVEDLNKEKGHGAVTTGYIYDFRNRYGIDFDLPTACEWEFAFRAGRYSETDYMDSIWTLDGTEAWYDVNSVHPAYAVKLPHPVGLKTANDWGFYDMAGNLWEWVLDWNSSTPDGGEDPLGPDTGTHRTVMGGSYASSGTAYQAKCSPNNWSLTPDGSGVTTGGYAVGFRLWAPAKAAK